MAQAGPVSISAAFDDALSKITLETTTPDIQSLLTPFSKPVPLARDYQLHVVSYPSRARDPDRFFIFAPDPEKTNEADTQIHCFLGYLARSDKRCDYIVSVRVDGPQQVLYVMLDCLTHRCRWRNVAPKRRLNKLAEHYISHAILLRDHTRPLNLRSIQSQGYKIGWARQESPWCYDVLEDEVSEDEYRNILDQLDTSFLFDTIASRKHEYVAIAAKVSTQQALRFLARYRRPRDLNDRRQFWERLRQITARSSSAEFEDINDMLSLHELQAVPLALKAMSSTPAAPVQDRQPPPTLFEFLPQCRSQRLLPRSNLQKSTHVDEFPVSLDERQSSAMIKIVGDSSQPDRLLLPIGIVWDGSQECTTSFTLAKQLIETVDEHTLWLFFNEAIYGFTCSDDDDDDEDEGEGRDTFRKKYPACVDSECTLAQVKVCKWPDEEEEEDVSENGKGALICEVVAETKMELKIQRFT